MTSSVAKTTLYQELRSCVESKAPKKQDALISFLKSDLSQPLTALLDRVIKKEKKSDDKWRDMMALFKNSLALKKHCGASFDTVLRKAEIWTLYFQWLSILHQNRPADSSIQSALKVKELIYTIKDLFFQGHFSNKEHTHTALQTCVELHKVGKSPEEMLESLNSIKRRVKATIHILENELLSRIGRVSDVASSAIRLITGNLYVARADQIVDAREKALENYPFLQLPKEGPYIALSKAVTAAGLLGIDIAQWGLLGLPENLLHSIAYQVNPGADKVFTLFEKVAGVDEKTTIAYLPIVNRFIQFTAFLGITTLTQGLSLETACGAGAAFLTAIAVSNATGHLVDTLYKKPEKASTHPFMSMVARSFTFSLTHTYLFPYLEGFLQTTQKPLSTEEAEQLLNVSSNAKPHEVNKAFREKAAACHPDGPKPNVTHLLLLQKAKETLL